MFVLSKPNLVVDYFVRAKKKHLFPLNEQLLPIGNQIVVVIEGIEKI